MSPALRPKLYTPLNMGAFDLRHRILLDLGEDEDAPAWLSGGIVLRSVPSAGLDANADQWRAVANLAQSGGSTLVARLGGLSLANFAAARHGQDGVVPLLLGAASRALSLGFAGIELDAGLFDLATSTDLLLSLVDALILTIGPQRLGIRLAAAPVSSAGPVLLALQEREVTYAHLAKPHGFRDYGPGQVYGRQGYSGILVTPSSDLRAAEELVESRWADAVCVAIGGVDATFLERLRVNLA